MPGPGAPVALDAMGGDHGVRLVLAGHAAVLHDLLREHGARAEIEVVHAPEVIPMGDSGVRIRSLPGTSAAVACGLVASGRAAALVSAGSTGGTVTAAVSRIGRVPGVARPPLAVLLPAPRSAVVLLDAGAIADPTPEMLAQFAVLGAAYASALLGTESPTVGLLTTGSEPGKGNRLARRAQPLLDAAPVKFIGNVEGSEALAGAADVVVTDGFTGNVALKAIEGSLRLALSETHAALTAGPAGALARFAARHRLHRLRQRFSADAQGGAVLLGVTGTVVVAHGSARARAIARACVLARDVARAAVPARVARAIASPPASSGPAPGGAAFFPAGAEP